MVKTQGIAAIYIIGTANLWLPYSLTSIYPSVGALFMLVPAHGLRGEKSEPRLLREYVRSLPDPEQKIRLVEGNWTDETKAWNYAASLAAKEKFELCLALESDEIYRTEELEAMRRFIESHPEGAGFTVQCRTYWKALRYQIEGAERSRPVPFIRPGKALFVDGRSLGAAPTVDIPESVGVCHHMGFAQPEREIEAKLRHLRGRTRIVPNWYENVWKRWDEAPTLTNLHPVEPGIFRAVHECSGDDLPPVLRRLYDRDPDFPLAPTSPLRARAS